MVVQSKIQNPRSTIVAGVTILLALARAEVGAQTTAVVHRMDGRVETIQLEGAQFESAEKGILRRRASGRSVEYRSNEIWQIELDSERVPRGSAEQLWLTDGSRLSGQLVKWVVSQRAVTWTDLFRTIELFDEVIAGLTRGDPPPSRLPVGMAGKDALYTTDGDRMAGQLLRIEDGDFAFRSELGNITCSRQKVSALVLAPKSAVRDQPSAISDQPSAVGVRKSEIRNPKSDGPWVLEFANGDRVWTQSWAIEGGRLRCTVGGGAPPAPAALLCRAVALGPRVEVFSRIQPQHFTMRPILAGTHAILVDCAPENRPLRIGEREYLFGLFLRPECEMEYALGDEAEFFLAQAGLSSELARDVGAARIAFALGDGPWKSFELTRNAAPVAISLGLSGSKRLRIRVEADDDWGCGAHVVLGEPVLIRRQK
jgi:hypothetical protein